MRGLSGAGLLLAAAACVHLTPFTPRALSDQRFPLRPGWSLALALDGSVGGHPAVIHLAVEEPLSRVTDGCFDAAPQVVARVRTPGPWPARPDGGPGEAVEEQVVASDVRLGRRTLGDVRALRDSGSGCEVTLGSEVLIGFVLEVDPGARTVTFHAEMPPPPGYQADESVTLELTLDPRTDRPSLAVQLDATGSPLTLPMLLATAAARVQVSVAAGRALTGKAASAQAPAPVLAPRSLAFAPGWELHHVVVSVLPEEAPLGEADTGRPVAGPSGVLGADAWGHFRTLIDLRGRQLVLYRRPPPVEGGNGPQSWTHLSSDSTRDGTLVRLISWQMLDSGGQVPLEPAHVGLHSCRIGLTLGPEDPGASLEVAIPWAGLEQALPDCARELASVPAWTGELVAGAPRPCTGTCLYAQSLPAGRTVCACSGRPSVAASVARQLLPAPAPVTAPEAGEPRDPGKSPPR